MSRSRLANPVTAFATSRRSQPHGKTLTASPTLVLTICFVALLVQRSLTVRQDTEDEKELSVSHIGISSTTSDAELVANKAVDLEGAFRWTTAAMGLGQLTNSFEQFAKSGMPIVPVQKGSATPKVNCWEAVLVTCMDAGVLDPGLMQPVFKEAMMSDMDYADIIEEWFEAKDAKVVSEQMPKRGDIILLFGGAHVALSLGGNEVMSLWYGPKGLHTFQRTTIKELEDFMISDKENVPIVADALNTVLNKHCGLSVFSTVCEDQDAASDAAYDVKDEISYEGEPTKEQVDTMVRYAKEVPVLVLPNPYPKWKALLAKGPR